MLTNLGWFIKSRDTVKDNIEELKSAKPDALLDDSQRGSIFKNLALWNENIAEQGGFETMEAAISFALDDLATATNAQMAHRFEHLLRSIDWDAQQRAFWLIAKAKLGAYGADFGKKVARGFPEATEEIREAGSCYALYRNDAAVFHLMRAVEYGLRGLALSMGVPDTGKVPLEYQVWNSIIEQIETRIDDDTIGRWADPNKSNARAFFSRTMSDLHAFKDETRNILMHSRSDGHYNGKEVSGVRERVRAFFNRLVEKEITDRGGKAIFDMNQFD